MGGKMKAAKTHQTSLKKLVAVASSATFEPTEAPDAQVSEVAKSADCPADVSSSSSSTSASGSDSENDSDDDSSCSDSSSGSSPSSEESDSGDDSTDDEDPTQPKTKEEDPERSKPGNQEFMNLLNGKSTAEGAKVLAGDPDREGGWRDALCHVTRQEFLRESSFVNVSVGGQDYVAKAREFTTGSFGFYLNRKVPMLINGHRVIFQMQCHLVALNSKNKAGRKRKRSSSSSSGTLVRSADPKLARRLKRAKQVTLAHLFGKPNSSQSSPSQPSATA